MGKPLTFVPLIEREGQLIVKIDEADVRSQVEYWQTALIGYVIGDTPYELAMDNYVTNVWNFVTKPQVLLHPNGYYNFKFKSIKDRDLILQFGP